MSDLLDILSAREDEILRALDGELGGGQCPTLLKTPAGGARNLYVAVAALCRDGDETPARLWVKSLEDGTDPGVPFGEVLAGLHCLERVVRYHVVESISQKTALVPALAELSDRVDQLRRLSAVAQPAAGFSGDGPRAKDFVALADSAGFLICLATRHGKPFYLNPAGRRMVGLPEDEATPATSLHRFYSEQSWAQLRDVAVPAVQQSGHWEGRSELRNVQSDDLMEVLTSVLLVKPSAEQRASFLAIIHRNAADWVRLEEMLAEAGARKHAILESALDPIITIDHRGVITEYNRAAEQTFRHPRQKVLGTRPSEVLFPASKSAGYRNRIERYLDAGEGSLLGRRVEVMAERAGGETFPAEMAMTINQEHGSPVLTFFVRDISSRKKAEEEQLRYAAELERSNRELEQFAYVASHDLQEPLRKIRTFGDRLEMKVGDGLDEESLTCLRRMQNAAARMQTLIEGLLTLSRITTHGQSFAPVNLADVAREVLSDLEAQIVRVDGRVEMDKLPTIQADRLQMRQLLQNLIGNALKFHRDDEPPMVSVRGRFLKGRTAAGGRALADERLQLRVEDNGIGFQKRHLERIFGVFQRLHPRDVYEGTGIGLAICRKIVERHGGEITARSEPGKGTTFEVWLPVVHKKRKKD